MRKTSRLLGLLAVLTAGAAHAGPATFYDGGTMSFSFQEIPFGTHGTFQSDGSVLDPSAFPAGGSGATTAICVEAAGAAYVLIAGGVLNADGTADVAMVFLQGPAPFGPGSFAVDPVQFTALFGFVDDATGFELPADLTTTDIDAWAQGIVAKDKFFGVAGLVSVTSFGPTQIQGMFAITASEMTKGTMLLIPDGIFSLGTTTAVDSQSWGAVKAAYAE